MAKLKWDEAGEHLYETGVSHGVLYILNNNGVYGSGIPWNGLTAVTESPTGAEASAIYSDNIKYLNLYSTEEFSATIEAYQYPDQFRPCNGEESPAEGVFIGRQPRKSFGFCYRTVLGNDIQGEDHGYKIHVLYGLRASPSEKNYQTINDSPEAVAFSFEVTSVPLNLKGFKPTSEVTVNSTDLAPGDLRALEARLYGSEITNPHLLYPDEIIEVITVGFLVDAEGDYITFGEDRIRV